MKKVNLLSMIAAFMLLACGGSKAQEYLITNDGVGNLKFSDAKPEFSAPYTVEHYFDDYEGVESYIVKDANGEWALSYEPGYLITVFSPEFKTQEGIHVGMNLSEAVKILSDNGKKVELLYENPMAEYIVHYGGDIALMVHGSELKGGMEKFNQMWSTGVGLDEVKLTDFSDDATITSIKVRK